jgi:site-specific recombinase XerD
MTPDAVLKALARRAAAAGIVARFSPHDLRRTFAGDMLDAGADIATVCALMGHSSVDVTARYDRRGEQVKARAAELLHFPY